MPCGCRLDYPGIGPEHSYLNDIGRAEYYAVTDDEALEAFQQVSRLEGIIPALETSHAFAYLKVQYPCSCLFCSLFDALFSFWDWRASFLLQRWSCRRLAQRHPCYPFLCLLGTPPPHLLLARGIWGCTVSDILLVPRGVDVCQPSFTCTCMLWCYAVLLCPG